jgi:NTE family protein
MSSKRSHLAPVNLPRRRFMSLAGAALLLATGCGRQRESPRIGLALGGGGAKGLAHIPMLEALDELGLRPHRIAGTSIGAIIGALYASGMRGNDIRDQVEQFLVKKDAERFISLPRSLRWLDFIDPDFDTGGLLDSSDFIAYIGELVPARRFRELEIPLEVVAADLWSGQPVILQSGELLPALQASMALPGVFPPVGHQGRRLVDGGIANPLPFDLLLDDCDLVIAVDVSGDHMPEDGQELSFLGVLFHSFHTMSGNLTREKLGQRRPDIYIRPDIRDVRVLEFYKADQIFGQAASARRELVKALQKRIPSAA